MNGRSHKSFFTGASLARQMVESTPKSSVGLRHIYSLRRARAEPGKDRFNHVFVMCDKRGDRFGKVVHDLFQCHHYIGPQLPLDIEACLVALGSKLELVDPYGAQAGSERTDHVVVGVSSFFLRGCLLEQGVEEGPRGAVCLGGEKSLCTAVLDGFTRPGRKGYVSERGGRDGRRKSELFLSNHE